MVLDDLVDGSPKSGISMLSLQRMLEFKSYKTVWTMGHKIRQAMAARDADYKLAGLIEMDDTYFGAAKTGKRGRDTASRAKVVIAVETLADKPGFAETGLDSNRVTHALPILTLHIGGYSILDASPGLRHEWLLPGSGKEAPKVLPWVHTLIANIKGNIRRIHHGVSPKYLPRYLADFCHCRNS
jgi:hypothetical protein